MTVRETHSPAPSADLSIGSRGLRSANTEWSSVALGIAKGLFLRDGEDSDTVDGLILRLVGALGAVATREMCVDPVSRPAFEEELCELLVGQCASFSSPVWMNWGAGNHRPSSSCYILSVEDSLDSIFSALRCQVEVFRAGGGCGQNMSAVRSSLEQLTTGVPAPGPVEFIRALAPVSRVLRSGGRERSSSNMFLLDIDHPNVLDFITLGEQLPPNCTMSVRVSDEFMRQAEQGAQSPWSPTSVTGTHQKEDLPARDVLRCIARQMLTTGEPGIQFLDTISSWHTCPVSGPIRGSNPCGEFLFLDDSAATLASLNLIKYFRSRQDFSIAWLCRTVELLTVSLDSIVGASPYPSAPVASTTIAHRPILIGFTNFATTLMALGLPYDSDHGRLFCSLVASLITATAYRQSAVLARRLGPFASFEDNRESMLGIIDRHAQAHESLPLLGDLSGPLGGLLAQLHSAAAEQWSQAAALGGESGFRNAQVTAIAPTGTISLLMDCGSTGIEPRLALCEQKHLRDGTIVRTRVRELENILQSLRSGSVEEGYTVTEVSAISEALLRGELHDSPLRKEHRNIFACAFSSDGEPAISPRAHLRMVEAAAPFVSGGISKTVLVSNAESLGDESVERVVGLLLEGWRAGVKGLTVYRVGTKNNEPVRQAPSGEN